MKQRVLVTREQLPITRALTQPRVAVATGQSGEWDRDGRCCGAGVRAERTISWPLIVGLKRQLLEP